MQISGETQILSPPAAILAAMQDPALWQALLPPGGRATLSGPGLFDLTFSKGLGLFMLSLPAVLRLVPRGRGFGQDLTFEAAHRLAGSIEVRLALDITPLPLDSLLTYSGEITASGPAARYLNGHKPRLASDADRLIRRLKRLIEDPDPPAA